MTDLFREVEEDLRREQFSKLWEKYGAWVLGLAVAIVLVTAAVVGWRAWVHSAQVADSVAYDAAVKEAAGAAPAEAAKAFAALAAEVDGGYETLARLQEADRRLAAGEADAARALYEQVANDGSVPGIMRGLAAIKAGLLLVDTASYEDMKARMAPLTSGESPWRQNALELVALTAMRAGEWQEADIRIKEIIADTATPAGLRDRAHVMQALIAPHLPRVAEEGEAAAPASAEPAPAEETQSETQDAPVSPAATE